MHCANLKDPQQVPVRLTHPPPPFLLQRRSAGAT